MEAESHEVRRGTRLSESWVKYGSTAAIVSILFYFGAALGVLPDKASLLLAFAFGPLLSVGFIGFYHFIKENRTTVTLQVATIFAVIAGTIVNMMLVVQQAIFQGTVEADRIAMGPAWNGLNLIQLGLDVSWDIYISLATILLGFAMWSHPRLGKFFSIVSIGLGTALLTLNLWTFPTPPGEAESIDLGPFVGLWFLVIAIRIRTSLAWWRANYV